MGKYTQETIKELRTIADELEAGEAVVCEFIRTQEVFGVSNEARISRWNNTPITVTWRPA